MTTAYPCYNPPQADPTGRIEETIDRDLTPGQWIGVFYPDGALAGVVDNEEYEDITSCPCCSRHVDLPAGWTVRFINVEETK